MVTWWLNKDVANILKNKADAIEYCHLERVSKIFHPIDYNQKLQKLQKYLITLEYENRNKRITR